LLKLVLLFFCCSRYTLAQEGWWPVGPPTITNTSIQTVGGITYFTHISLVGWGDWDDCRRVSSGPVSRLGTNLYLTINEELWTGVCVCYPCRHSETHVSVLGALPGGTYFLTLSCTEPFAPPRPFRWLGVTVPSSDTQTLLAFVDTNRIHLIVAGIPNVRYVIEASSTFTNWVSVKTNVGGPFTWSEQIATETHQRFYRIRIAGE